MSAKARVAKLELAIQEAGRSAEAEAREQAGKAALAALNALTDDELLALEEEEDPDRPGEASRQLSWFSDAELEWFIAGRVEKFSDAELALIIMEGRM